jgi:hypothetical protein
MTRTDCLILQSLNEAPSTRRFEFLRDCEGKGAVKMSTESTYRRKDDPDAFGMLPEAGLYLVDLRSSSCQVPVQTNYNNGMKTRVGHA